MSEIKHFSLICLLLSMIHVSQTKITTSVWCHGSHQDHRHCNFHNLCYYPQDSQYIFFHNTNGSVISGVDDPQEQINLVRLSAFSSNLNDLYLNYVVMPEAASHRFDVEFVESPVFLMKRWKPMDSFHMIHDDLIPLYLTLKFLCFNDFEKCFDEYVIGVEDQFKSELYEHLFPNMMYLSRYATFFSDDQLLCFKKVIVGLEHESIWYNHGFDGPSGPIHNINFQPHLLESFRNFVLKKLNIQPKPLYDVLIFENELFANSEEILNHLKSSHKNLKIKTFDPSKTPILKVIRDVSCSRSLISFHSPFNVFSLFLNKDTSKGLLEIFPPGLDESSCGQFHKLCTLRGLNYQSWIPRDDKCCTPNTLAKSLLSRLDQETAEAISGIVIESIFDILVKIN